MFINNQIQIVKLDNFINKIIKINSQYIYISKIQQKQNIDLNNMKNNYYYKNIQINYIN